MRLRFEFDKREIGIGAIFFAFAATVLGFGIETSYGVATPMSMTALTISILAFALGVVTSGNSRLVVSTSSFFAAMAGCLAIQFVLLAMAFPPMVRHTAFDMSHYAGAICLASLLGGLILVTDGRSQKIAFWGVVVTLIATACWLLLAGGPPFIDVYVSTKFAVHYLFNGINPYAVDYPNIYSPAETIANYGPGFAHGSRLPYGYTYPPVMLFFTALGECFFRDFRIGHAAAVGAAAIFIAHMKSNRWSYVIAVLLLSSPSTFFILHQGWIEPLCLLLLAAASWCWFRAPRIFPFVLGLFFASKQYLILLFPLVFLLVPGPVKARPTILFLAKVIGSACIVSLPLALLNLPAFLHSTVMFHVRTGFRPDSMSYAIWFPQTARPMASLLSFVLCFLVVIVSLCFFRRSYKNFLVALIAALFVFFIFNKQAFANYYYLVTSSIWVLAGVLVSDAPSSSVTSSIHASSSSNSPASINPFLTNTV